MCVQIGAKYRCCGASAAGTSVAALCLGAILGPLAPMASAKPPKIPFQITDGSVVPKQTFAAKVTVLGAEVSYNGEYDAPVTVEVHVGSDNIDPFGPHDLPLDGNVNDANNPRNLVVDQYDKDTTISVTGRVWLRQPGTDGSDNSEWYLFRQHESHSGTPYVLVLRDGDDVPEIEGFDDQSPIKDYLQPYVDAEGQKIVLQKSQAIYLFEFNPDLDSPAADFQDLVVLITLGGNQLEAAIGDVAITAFD